MRPILKVEWVDSAQPNPAWQWVSDINKKGVIQCSSVGFLIHQTKTEIGLAISIGGELDLEQASGYIRIPIDSIKKTTLLTKGR